MHCAQNIMLMKNEKLPRLREQIQLELNNISNLVHADDFTTRHCKNQKFRLWESFFCNHICAFFCFYYITSIIA